MTPFQKIEKIREIKEDILDLKNTCGSCDLWMTQQCNREKKHKVSCGEKICEQFKIKDWVVKHIDQNEKELEIVTNTQTESDFAIWGL